MFSSHSFITTLKRSLRLRVLAMIIAGFAIVALPAVVAFNWLVNSTIISLGTLFAEKQILYDRSRGLEALMREVALAETLARSPVVLDWAANENDVARQTRGIAELEHYRMAFRDKSYFFVVAGSGNYYFNDRDGAYLNQQFRYTLSRDNPRDGWFYRTIGTGPGCKLNVDQDDTLAVTKVWINCVVQEGDRPLGVLGTGIDLTMFIRNVVNSDQTGVESMFVDATGAIQANRDARKIDFHSLTKEMSSKKTIFQLLDGDGDRAQMTEMMAAAEADPSHVEARFLTVGGTEMLVGVGYLDRLGWYKVTVMDVDAIIDRRLFLPIGLLLGAVMLAVAVVMSYAFKRSVLDRLAAAERLVDEVEHGRSIPAVADTGQDEIGKLSRALLSMAQAVEQNRLTLETAVSERTQQLRRMAMLDPLTGLLNRRGFQEMFDELDRSSGRCGLLLIDIDHFKQINDTRGHQAGDEVINAVVARMRHVAGSTAKCVRWGGDEFVICCPATDAAGLARLADDLLGAIRSSPVALTQDRAIRVTASIGAHLCTGDETLDQATDRVDQALYDAKRAGRNRVCFSADQRSGDNRVA